MRPILLKLDEAAKLASIGRTKAYSLVSSGEWPSVRIGRAVRVPYEDLREWVDGNRTVERRNRVRRKARHSAALGAGGSKDRVAHPQQPA